MKSTPTDITTLLLTRLAISEARLLTLTVFVRGKLHERGGYRGDLGRAVQLALRNLLKSKRITDADGAYSLARGVAVPKAVSQGKSS